MTLPNSRATFKETCLRRLGKPVIQINVSEEQVDDAVDYCLSYYWDYHFDGAEKHYYKHVITANNMQDSIYHLQIANGGTAYSNADTITFTSSPTSVGNGASATLTTNSTGGIVSVNLANNGGGYAIAPTVTINTSTGSGASITAELGGWIQMPENINGVVRIFDISSALGNSPSNMFSVTYQIALNDLWTFMSSSLVPYYMTMTHLRLLEEILVGQQEIRFSRHKNRLHVDVDWNRFTPGNFLVIEAYQIIDPEVYTDVWKDRWLMRYAEAHIKKQWGSNMKKMQGMPLPGGLMFNGQQIYDEAIAEINQLEQEMMTSYSIPSAIQFG